MIISLHLRRPSQTFHFFIFKSTTSLSFLLSALAIASADFSFYLSAAASSLSSRALSLASLASFPLTVFGSDEATAALSSISFASYLALTSLRRAASSSAAALLASAIAFPFTNDSAVAISAADLVVDTPYYGLNDEGGATIILSLLSPGLASPPSMAEA